ncbi:hypothetical protein Pryu01_02371 [Paraliobacillus ryukyuensis]|uniref:Uncharacterized protein n=1 Tax=Paraliobacillus ryukyuensis TaxID=200904 RepID=A0A366DX03_9BACI|nr:hypothetical protein [Paraliobacillus ryukyuensis]RBO94587.1 hypothetical protein DES48_11074 [Paraliobacillus ryukyuensis]
MKTGKLYFETSEDGKLKQIKRPRTANTDTTLISNDKELPIFLEKLRHEWDKRAIKTDQLDKLEAFTATLKHPEVQKTIIKIIEKVKSLLTSDKVKGALTKMSSSNFSDLLKKLTSNEDASKLMDQVMRDPKLSKDAMEMMKDVLNDKEKFHSLTEMMSSMMNNDNDKDKE